MRAWIVTMALAFGIATMAARGPVLASGTISIMAPDDMPKRQVHRHARPRDTHRAPVVRRHDRARRHGSGGLVVIPRAPVGPAPSGPATPTYRPPSVQAPAQRPFCQSRGQAFDPATHSFVTGGGICY